MAQAPVVSPESTYKVGDVGPAGGIVFYPVVGTSNVPPTTAQSYKVGDRRPAGCIIFFINLAVEDGWKYLEAAPAMTEVTSK